MNSLQKAFNLTGSFEGGGYANLSGNFDGQGVSFGFLQWNFGQGTLQPLLKEMARVDREAFRRCFTRYVREYEKTIDLSPLILNICDKPKDQAVAWAKERQNDATHRLYPHWTDSFKALAQVEAFQAVQRKAAKSPYMDLAIKYLISYGFKSERAICLMFDITVQMGSIGPGAKLRYMQATVGKALTEEQRMEALAKAIAPQGGRWASDVLSRKLTIALGKGIVHGRPYNLEKDYGITMKTADLTDAA